MRNSTFNAVARTTYWLDSSSGPQTVNLPSSPTVGDWVRIYDAELLWNSNNLTVNGNGNNVRKYDQGLNTYTAPSVSVVVSSPWPYNPAAGSYGLLFVWNGTVWSSAIG